MFSVTVENLAAGTSSCPIGQISKVGNHTISCRQNPLIESIHYHDFEANFSDDPRVRSGHISSLGGKHLISSEVKCKTSCVVKKGQ